MDDKRPAFVFRLNDHGEGPEIIREALMDLGWLEFDEDTQDESDWNLWWRTSRFRRSDYTNLNPWQRLNHFPGATAITKKDCLARHMKRMQGVYGQSIFNFSPLAFNLPNDYTRFVSESAKLKERGADLFWICKPADLSRGRGIFIFKEPLQLTYDSNAVVQQYIRNPMLISGYKFDLRIYVVVTSFNPLRVYVHEEGLVRFSTEKFDLSCLDNMFAHLTNTSINKHSPSYNAEKERVGSGCKWTITQLRHYFRQSNIDDHPIWTKICNIIILTLLVQAGSVPQSQGCFELYGFDIILDDNMKPWLLEVNFSPAMSVDCLTDTQVKKPVLHDLFSIIDFQEHDKLRGAEHQLNHVVLHARNMWHANPERPILPRSTSVQGRFPSIQHPTSKTSPRLNEPEDWSDEEDFARVVAGCGLPSVQQRSRSVTGPLGCDRPFRRLHGSSSSQSFIKTSVHSLHSDSGVSSMSGSSERNEDSTQPTPQTTVERKPSTSKTSSQTLQVRMSRKITSSKVTTHRLPSSAHSTGMKNSNIGTPSWRSRARFSSRGVRGQETILPKFPAPNRIPQDKVGGFHLLFPFNDTTNKCSLTSMDPRLLIKETQRLLKQNFCKSKSESSSSKVQFSLPWPPVQVNC